VEPPAKLAVARAVSELVSLEALALEDDPTVASGGRARGQQLAGRGKREVTRRPPTLPSPLAHTPPPLLLHLIWFVCGSLLNRVETCAAPTNLPVNTQPTKVLTPLGVHLASLPVDCRLGKLLLLGAVFGCADEALTIAATLSQRSPFLCPAERRAAADAAKLSFASHHRLVQTDTRVAFARTRPFGLSRSFWGGCIWCVVLLPTFRLFRFRHFLFLVLLLLPPLSSATT
jgi:hypothetical protein